MESILLNIYEGNGYSLTIVGMTVVFVSLIILSLSIFILDNFSLAALFRKKKEEKQDNKKLNNEVLAAIVATYIHYQKQIEEEESLRITLSRVNKPFSPWVSNSKFNMPNKMYYNRKK